MPLCGALPRIPLTPTALWRLACSVRFFAGMIAASAIGLFVIPMLYVTFQTIRERSGARFRRLRLRSDAGTD
jgi:hypothetical protein